MRLSRLVPAAGAAFFVFAGQAFAVVPLVQHRAVYDLSLEKATDRSGITGINGRMVYELRGSACEGYTIRFRYVTQSDTRESSQINDQQTTTFEEGNFSSFSFSTKSYTDRSLDKELRGTATHEGRDVKVVIDKPEHKEVDLEPALFPTEHLVDLIARANKGETFYETTIFDGSEDADKIMTTTVVVGRKEKTSEADPERKTLSTLTDEAYWPVDIAYFDEEPEGGEDTPEYRIGFKLYENGLTRDLEMDYGDFVVRGRLVDLALFDGDPACTR